MFHFFFRHQVPGSGRKIVKRLLLTAAWVAPVVILFLTVSGMEQLEFFPSAGFRLGPLIKIVIYTDSQRRAFLSRSSARRLIDSKRHRTASVCVFIPSLFPISKISARLAKQGRPLLPLTAPLSIVVMLTMSGT